MTMFRHVWFFQIFVAVNSGKIFIDRYTLDFDQKLGNWSTSFYNDVNHVAVVNLTIEPFKTVAKFLVYMRVNLAEDENDREYRKEFIRTVFDAEKWYAGGQKNLIVKYFMNSLKEFMDFELKMPMPPKKYNFVNFVFNIDYVPFFADVRGSVQFRVVGKVESSNATKFFACLTYFGGFLVN